MGNLFVGKFLEDGSVAETKLATAFTETLIRRNGTVAFTGPQSMGNQRLTNLGAPTSQDDAARLKDIYLRPYKGKCRVATVSNITLSGSPTVDSVTVNVSDRVLVRAQLDRSENGIYVAQAGSWVRAADNDEVDEINTTVVNVDQGATLANTVWQLQDEITTLGTDDIEFIEIGGGTGINNVLSSWLKNPALAVAADGGLAVSTGITGTPNGVPIVRVNTKWERVGNGVKTEPFYFSGDSGSAARAHNAIVTGDLLYFNPTIAGYDLETTDTIDVQFIV